MKGYLYEDIATNHVDEILMKIFDEKSLDICIVFWKTNCTTGFFFAKTSALMSKPLLLFKAITRDVCTLH